MPQITKLRIVNFKYNGGKRMIPDETFRFDSADGMKAFHTLISMANGGGKSVLTQLMIQPILPKEKIGNRKIEDFFDKASDHCFILLEWKINRTARLMTGIAFTARALGAMDEDDVKGFAAGYYTFCHEYSLTGNKADKFSLEAIELSENRNGKFLSKPYPYVRELARTSRKISCFPQDQQKDYRELLEGYGIVRNEWRTIISKINQVEGGVSNMFEACKTDDALLDKLLLPCVEESIQKQQREQDASLETMLLAYANDYKDKEKTVRLQKRYEELLQVMETQNSAVSNLYDLYAQYEECLARLDGFTAAMKLRQQELTVQQESLNEKLVKCDKELAQIELEKRSDSYYKATAKYNDTHAEYETLRQKQEELKQQIALLSHQADVLECARIYQQMQGTIAKREAYRTKIAELEGDAAANEKLERIKYTIKCLAEQELQKQKIQFDALSSVVERSKLEQNELSAQLLQYTKEHRELVERMNRSQGALSNEQQQICSDAEKQLGIFVQKRLDKTLVCAELPEQNKQAQQQLENCIQLLAALEKEETDCITAQKTWMREQASIEQKSKEITAEIQQVDADLAEYHTKEDVLRPILKRLGIPFSQRFTEQPINALLRAQEDAETNAVRLNHELEQLTEQRTAVQNGELHIPKSIIDTLKSENIEYQTCDSYFHNLPLSAEAIADLLKQYPQCAYGIIVRESVEKLAEMLETVEWMPSVLPVYGYSDIDKMLKGTYSAQTGLLAKYSQSYFLEQDSFIEKLESNIMECHKTIEQLKQRIQLLSEEQAAVQGFVYTAEWEQDQISKRIQLQEQRTVCEGTLAQIELDNQKTEERIKQIKQERREQAEEQYQLKTRLSVCAELEERVRKNAEKVQELLALEHETELAEKMKTDIQSKLNRCQELQTEKENSLEQIKQRMNMLSECLEETQNVKSAALVDGSIDALVTELHAYQRSLDGSVASWSNQIQECSENIEKYKKELCRYDIAQSEYTDIAYSWEESSRIRQRKDDVQKQKDEQDKQVDAANRADARAEKGLETAANELHELLAEPLQMSEIKYSFSEREYKERQREKQIQEQLKTAIRLKEKLERLLQDCAEKHRNTATQRKISVVLSADLDAQKRLLCTLLDDAVKQFETAQNAFQSELRTMYQQFTDIPETREIFSGMQTFLNDGQDSGNIYYTLSEHLDAHIENLKKTVQYYMLQIEGLKVRQTELIHQCVLQGESLFENLWELCNCSKVKFKDRPKLPMLKLEMPEKESIDPVLAERRIQHEIEAGVQNLVDILHRDESEKNIRDYVQKLVSSRRLLHQYIGSEAIPVKVFKIDLNMNHSKYRSWQNTRIQNSGGERFVVYFAVLLSMMKYSRRYVGGALEAKPSEINSVLIMDNPFGVITSAHLLEPMFEIARQFSVQLICLSDISKADVTQCFDSIIKVVIKQIAFSDKEVLQLQESEQIEKAFYAVEQQSLF